MVPVVVVAVARSARVQVVQVAVPAVADMLAVEEVAAIAVVVPPVVAEEAAALAVRPAVEAAFVPPVAAEDSVGRPVAATTQVVHRVVAAKVGVVADEAGPIRKRIVTATMIAERRAVAVATSTTATTGSDRSELDAWRIGAHCCTIDIEHSSRV